MAVLLIIPAAIGPVKILAVTGFQVPGSKETASLGLWVVSLWVVDKEEQYS
jgi:hypothetical protein